MRLSLLSLALTSALRSAAVSLAGVAPTLSSPSMGSVTSAGGAPTVTTNKASGTLYYAVLTNGGSATDAQIIAGSGGNIVAGKAGNQAVTATGVNTFAAVTGLLGSTDYEVVFLQVDAESPANTSAQATAGFTTSAAAEPSLALTQVSASSVVSGSPDSDIVITVTGTTNKSVASGVFGVEWGIGIDSGYVYSVNVVGVSGSPDTQLITIGSAEGIAQGDIVNLRAYVNEDALDPQCSRVYGNDIAPVISSVSVSGNLSIGGQMVISHGVIVGPSPMTRSYQWERSTGSPTEFSDITEGSPPGSPQIGAQERIYTVQSGDSGYEFRGMVTVTKGASSDSERSTAVGPITSAETFFTPSHVGSVAISHTNGTSTTNTLAAQPSAGNLIILYAMTALNVSSITDDFGDSGSGAYTLAVGPIREDSNGYGLNIYYRVMGTGGNGTGVTITLNHSGSDHCYLGNSVFSKDGGTWAYDVSTPTVPASAEGNTGTSATCGTFTSGTDKPLIVAFGSGSGGGAGLLVGTGSAWTGSATETTILNKKYEYLLPGVVFSSKAIDFAIGAGGTWATLGIIFKCST